MGDRNICDVLLETVPRSLGHISSISWRCRRTTFYTGTKLVLGDRDAMVWTTTKAASLLLNWLMGLEGCYTVVSNASSPSHLHLATSEMWCWSAGRGMLRKLSLCYSSVYCSNGAQRYKQFLQVGRLCQVLILLSLAMHRLSAAVSSIFMVLYA